MIRKAREKSFDALRTALTVCQAISMAITVVLPLPVAIFHRQAEKRRVGLSVGVAIWSRNALDDALFGATSVSQMIVSTASIWQKKGVGPLNLWCRQCSSSRCVAAVTPTICRVAQGAPCVQVAPDRVDQRVFGVGLQIERRPGWPPPFSAMQGRGR